MHPALRTKTWKRIKQLLAQRKQFYIRNEIGEVKVCVPGTPIYDLHELRGWFKFCYEMGDIMTVEEVADYV